MQDFSGGIYTWLFICIRNFLACIFQDIRYNVHKAFYLSGPNAMKKLFILLICIFAIGLTSTGCCGGGNYDERNADSENCDNSGW